MKKTFSGMMLLAAALAFSGPAAADSMRCGTKLMTDGDPADKVEAYCGRPASIERHEIVRPYYYNHGYPIHSAYEVSVELWTYNSGRTSSCTGFALKTVCWSTSTPLARLPLRKRKLLAEAPTRPRATVGRVPERATKFRRSERGSPTDRRVRWVGQSMSRQSFE
jgi:hypothetical protein